MSSINNVATLLIIGFLCFCFQMGFDVFNALDLMENKSFLEKLKFGIGDGNLQYYLYNWKCPAMEPKQVRLSQALFCFLRTPRLLW